MKTGMGMQVRKRLRGTEYLLEVSFFEFIYLNSTLSLEQIGLGKSC